MPRRNIAARAGRWSARRRRAVALAWIAFVVVAVMAGSAAGTKKLADENMGNGDSRTAAQAIARAGLKQRATEQVLIQSRGSLTAADAPFRAAIADVERRVAGQPYVIQLSSPFSKDAVASRSG